MIKKILLINTPRIALEALNAGIEREIYPPLGLMYISASTKEAFPDIEVSVLDLHYETLKRSHDKRPVDWYEICDEKIKSFSPDIIGFSVLFGNSLARAGELSKQIRKNYPHILLVAGGVHITGMLSTGREKSKATEIFDAICMSESENHFPGLIRYLNGIEDSLQGVVINTAKLLRNPEDLVLGLDRPQVLDSLPIPDFGCVDLTRYSQYGIVSGSQTYERHVPIATLQTTRGCIAACTFCSVRNFNGKGVRLSSPERVLQEIDILYNRYDIRHIDFVDDDFTYDKDRCHKILDGLIDRRFDLTWSIRNGIRLGSLDEPLLDKMARSGCRYFSIGIESGDPKVLRETKKPLTLRILREKAPLLHKFPEIYYRANFIVGFPGETAEQRQMTYDLAEEIALDWNQFSILTPLPDTPIFEKIREEETTLTADDINYTFDASTANSSFLKEKIVDEIYTRNLEINFLKNPNLLKKEHLPRRALMDFKRVSCIAPQHAVAWHLIAKTQEQLGAKEEAKSAHKKTSEILAQSGYWREKFKTLGIAEEVVGATGIEPVTIPV